MTGQAGEFQRSGIRVLRTPSPEVHDSPHLAAVPTPLTRLTRIFPAARPQLWAKLENLQVSGSAKERPAAAMVEGLERDGLLRPGGTIVESTSGNLGVALARRCAVAGYRFVAVVDDRANEASVRTMQAFGAEIDLVEVGVGGNRLVARVARVRELLDLIPGAVTPDQYARPDNPAAHEEGTLPELVAALGRPPTHLYVATSTAGTLLGCQQAIRSHRWGTTLVAVDATGSALWGGEPGERKMPGLGAGFVTEHALHATPAVVHRVDESDMVRGCRLLARREGLLTGASTGAIVAAVGRDLPHLGEDALVAMLVHDGGAPYLNTVYDDVWVRAELADPARALAEDAGDWPFAALVDTPTGGVDRAS
ncbi:cysteine synthase family protein [Nocardioides yefusunii]|uniref:Cysteine synthase family protein n=1 Tax=Nocardioides yefusunii TaxID=2500546 RepID=A0ABW1QSZ5_9ACTN|nr:cysteine synthase family protein [Nocardioides yefusunii]